MVTCLKKSDSDHVCPKIEAFFAPASLFAQLVIVIRAAAAAVAVPEVFVYNATREKSI